MKSFKFCFLTVYIKLYNLPADSFTSSFPICMPFFSCLIPVAGTSKTVLNRSGERGISFLFLSIEEKLSVFRH